MPPCVQYQFIMIMRVQGLIVGSRSWIIQTERSKNGIFMVLMKCSMWLVDSMSGWIGKGSQGRGLEVGLNTDWWRLRVWRLNLANGSAGVELILFALELSGLRIRELCLYARHLLSIMMSHSRPYHVPWWGWMSWQTGRWNNTECNEPKSLMCCFHGCEHHFTVLSQNENDHHKWKSYFTIS